MSGIAHEASDKAIGDLTEFATRLAARRGIEAEINTGDFGVIITQSLWDAMTKGDEVLKKEYNQLKIKLSKRFGAVKVAAKGEVARTMEELMGTGANPALKVIVLDKGWDEDSVNIKDIAIPNRSLGVDYCSVNADATTLGMLNETTVPFVNLYAMSFMGIGVLNRQAWLFEMAYKAFAGENYNPKVLDKIVKHVQQGVQSIVYVIPRIVRFETGIIREQETLDRIFRVAA